MTELGFYGAVGTVTGSKYLLEAAGKKILIDCGLFQGYKLLRLRNWASLSFGPRSVDAVILTHAHLDHSGYLPLLLRNGFKGKIFATAGTRDLCGILLPDSGYLHERDAEFANRHGFSKHKPALPLYTEAEGEAAAKNFSPVEYGERVELAPGLSARFDPAGHILGSAIVTFETGGRKIVFSGDLGRPGQPVLVPPARIEEADYLIVESTYGNRLHNHGAPEDALAGIINRAAEKKGVVLIPAFAVGRTQMLLYYLSKLRQQKRIGEIPVFVDSPMAIEATEVFRAHPGEHRLTPQECAAAFHGVGYARGVEDSKELDARSGPMILISASGMATGGRVLHHLKRFAPDPRNVILFAGFQAGGTRGEAMVSGAREIKIHGEYVPVAAEVDQLDMLSAHADQGEILGWLGGFRRAPTTTFITHGEPAAADALRRKIREKLGWECVLPEYCQKVELG